MKRSMILGMAILIGIVCSGLNAMAANVGLGSTEGSSLTNSCTGLLCALSGGTCVNGVCVTPTPTPTPGGCDELQCKSHGGQCVDGVCVIPTPTPTPTCYSKEQLDAAVAAERQKWDANGDGKIGLEEAIRALQIVSGVR